jgi:hypothetical protein
MSLLTHELWARVILASGALVVVPLGLNLVNRRAHAALFPNAAARTLRYALLPAALLLAAAQWSSAGPYAAALAVPWLIVTALVALAGLGIAWKSRRGPLPEFVAACGLMFLVIGGGWALADRAGIRPLGFDPAIVLLTAVHFHYAGFALPILAGLAIDALHKPEAPARDNPTHQPEASARDPRSTAPPAISLADASGWCTALGVVASVPLTAVGITATQLGLSPVWELIAAWCMSLSGLGVAWLYLRLAFLRSTPRITRELWSYAALFLACGMVLSILYGSRWLVPLPWLDIPLMRALHGTANALGFTVPCLIGWCFADADGDET